MGGLRSHCRMTTDSFSGLGGGGGLQITLRCDATVDELIDIIESTDKIGMLRVYIPCVYVCNMIDKVQPPRTPYTGLFASTFLAFMSATH